MYSNALNIKLFGFDNYLYSKNKNRITFYTMRKFEDQLSRMQSLMTYGMVSESENKKGSFEYHRVASDGKAYGIFKECSKYYIKTAPGDKETIAEAYDYIGGWNNRKDYEYDSYANAQKQFDLKMMSINEAFNVNGNAVTLDPSKKQEFIVEGTDKMKQEIARQRQIMENVNTIMNEGSYIGVGDPEKVSGNNDADKPYTEKGEAKLDKDMPKASGKPESESEPYGDGKAPEKGKDVKSGDVLSDGTAVAAEHPSGGKVVRVNEGCEGGECAPNGARDWGTEGIGKGNGDPKQNGWEMEGQEYVNEEINDAKEWDEGLPGSAGTGEADNDHNNDPFKETVNESEEGDDEYEVEGGDEESDEKSGEDKPKDVEGEDAPVDKPSDTDGESEPEFGDEEGLGGEDELGDELGDDLGNEGEEELEGDLESEIAELRAEIEALKAQLGGEDEMGGEVPPMDGEDVPPVSDELGAEGEPSIPELGAAGEEGPAESELGAEDDIDLGDEGDMEECGARPMFESKEAYMNSIVESVVKSILGEASKKQTKKTVKEEKTVLHDFGKHPGYRKKPMDLPPTGSDQENGMRDWNDDSVHSEAPFGSKIGDGKPYEKLVQMITDSVMENIKKKA